MGKYKGMTYQDMVKSDPEYSLWMKTIVRNEQVKDWLEENVPSIGTFKLKFGKYKGETYDTVLRSDPDYARFLQEVEKKDYIKEYIGSRLTSVVFPV